MSAGYIAAPGSLWCYAPNKGAPIAFAVLFLLSGILHVYQSLHYHSWKVTGLLPWAAALFVAGFIIREVGAYHHTSEGLYISSTRLLLIAPAVYEGANYFVLGRAKQHLSRDLLRAAMLLQLATMALFVDITIRFHVLCRRAGVLKRNLRNVILYFEGAIPAAAVREAESGGGERSPMVCNEYTFLNVFHPARFLPRNYKVFLARDGQTEMEGPGDANKRGWIQSILDPFDLIGLVRKKDVEYWEVEERELGRDVTERRDR
ncbi:hypothetical protein K523DRAFT_369685 [Schizophyllum commune Tattone D]|nr:hypothetical protein K523DRAFT_369685 [Schizophyllum commune Tattone D]